MLEIRTTLSWNLETDPDIIRGIMSQPGVSVIETPIGRWIKNDRPIIGFIYQDKYYFKPQNTEESLGNNIHTSITPPTRAQRYVGLRWHNRDTGVTKKWDGKEWTDFAKDQQQDARL